MPVLSFAVAAQIALGMATFSMAASLGIKVTLLDCIVLMQPVALLANLPISVGGWGVRETAVVLLFGLIGVPSSAALVLSLQLGLACAAGGASRAEYCGCYCGSKSARRSRRRDMQRWHFRGNDNTRR